MFDRSSGKQIAELETDGYLTYVSEVGDYVVAFYITLNDDSTVGAYVGQILDSNAQVLANLPQLTDVLPDGTLVFDNRRGDIRVSRIYSIDYLLSLAH